MTAATLGLSLDDLEQASVLAGNVGMLGVNRSAIGEFGRTMLAGLPGRFR